MVRDGFRMRNRDLGRHRRRRPSSHLLVLPDLLDSQTSNRLCPDHPSVLETLKAIPRGARAVDKQRVRRHLALIAPEPAQKAKDMSLTDKEFANHVVRLKLSDTVALQGYVTFFVVFLEACVRTRCFHNSLGACHRPKAQSWNTLDTCDAL